MRHAYSAAPAVRRTDTIMSISFQCPACGKGFTVSDELAGKQGKCKQCGGVISVPRKPPTKPAPLPPVDLYDLDEESAPLPPLAAMARSTAGEDAPKPRGGSRKTKRSTSDESKSRGFFAGIGG